MLLCPSIYTCILYQVAHIAGYDDEHHLEKAPILEIDPIPDERTQAEGLQRLQVFRVFWIQINIIVLYVLARVL